MAAQVRTAKTLILGSEIKHMIENSPTLPGLSHAEVGELIGASPATITRLVWGIGTITADDLKLLATKLGFIDDNYINDLLKLRCEAGKHSLWVSGHLRADGDASGQPGIELDWLVSLAADALKAQDGDRAAATEMLLALREDLEETMRNHSVEMLVEAALRLAPAADRPA